MKPVYLFGDKVNIAKIQIKEVAMRISFSLRSLLMFIVLVTVFMFATTAAMADKGSRLSDKSVVALKAPDDIGKVSVIPKGDGVFVATGILATDPRDKVTYLTNIIPLTHGDTIGHNIIVNSRPTITILGIKTRIGFPLRC